MGFIEVVSVQAVDTAVFLLKKKSLFFFWIPKRIFPESSVAHNRYVEN